MKFTHSRRSRSASLLGGVLALCMLAAACGGAGAAPDADKHGGDTIIIGGVHSREDSAVRALWARLLDERGYDVEVRHLDRAAIYAGLANSTIDIFLSARLSDKPSELMRQYGANLAKLGVWYQNLTEHGQDSRGGQDLWVLTRQNFARDAPKVAQWLRNFQLGHDQFRRLEDLMFGSYPDEPRKAVDKWISDNHELINMWIRRNPL